MAGSAERSVRVYTRTGDRGETGLIGGDRVPKCTARMDAIGDVDELNAAIGVCRLHSGKSSLDAELASLQSLLFELGAELATPASSRFVNETLEDRHVKALEQSMDAQSTRLAPLKNFVLPGGSPLGAGLHFARAVCRRAERSVLSLSAEADVRPIVLQYMNRLSDWLFVAARTANREAGVEDVKWVTGGR
jgi:cob(I)alamin adenosyltransferase